MSSYALLFFLSLSPSQSPGSVLVVLDLSLLKQTRLRWNRGWSGPVGFAVALIVNSLVPNNIVDLMFQIFPE